jgi:hypothetical protein
MLKVTLAIVMMKEMLCDFISVCSVDLPLAKRGTLILDIAI